MHASDDHKYACETVKACATIISVSSLWPVYIYIYSSEWTLWVVYNPESLR